MSTTTDEPKTVSLLKSDQPISAVEEYRCIKPSHFLDFDVINVTTRKTHSYTKKKSSSKVSLNFLHQIIVNNLIANDCVQQPFATPS